jgi:hypothetical protein
MEIFCPYAVKYYACYSLIRLSGFSQFFNVLFPSGFRSALFAHSVLFLFLKKNTEKTSFDAQQAEARYDSKKPNFPASFVTLASLYNDASNFEHKYDVVASFDFLDGILFESNQSLTNMLKLVSSLLRPGGFFFGMLVDGAFSFSIKIIFVYLRFNDGISLSLPCRKRALDTSTEVK